MSRKFFWIFLAILALYGMAQIPIFPDEEAQPLTQWNIPPNPVGRGENLLNRNGAVIWRYPYNPGKPSVLLQMTSLTEFREIRLSILSAKQTGIALFLQDQDGATFHYFHPVPAEEEIQIAIHPSDFQLNDDSPVKKERLDPERADGLLFLADPNPMRNEGENTIQINSASIAYEPIQKETGDLIVDNFMKISENSERFGNILIKPGGHLAITAHRFVLHGNVECDGGSLDLLGGTMVIPEHFFYEHHLIFSNGGQFKIQDALLSSSGFPLGLQMSGSATSLFAQNAKFMPMVTTPLNEKSKVRLVNVPNFGEMVIPPGASVDIQDSQIKLWLAVARNVKGELTLPESGRIEDWKAGHGLNLSVRHSMVAFAIVSIDGSDAVIKNTHLASVALFFGKNTNVDLQDIHDGEMISDYLLPASDRKLRFKNTRVDTWGFYPIDHASVKVKNTTFGEVNISGEATIEIRDSICDGSQGYVGSDGRSRIKLVNCKVTTSVIARENSTIVLENCNIVGDVIATDNAVIKLVNTKVVGKMEKEGNARLIQ